VKNLISVVIVFVVISFQLFLFVICLFSYRKDLKEMEWNSDKIGVLIEFIQKNAATKLSAASTMFSTIRN